MKRKLIALALCMAMTASVFTGCTDSDTISGESTSDESQSEDSSFSYPFTLTDAYGNEVTIEEEPETVVSVSPALTEIIYDLGGEDKLIGRSDYCDYPEEVYNIQSVGPIDLPDTELIVSLDPDVVLASSIFSEEAYDALVNAGITVVIIKDEDSLDGMFTYVQTTADVIGLHEEGEDLVEVMEEQLAQIEGEVNDTIAGDDITVYYCMGFGEYGDYTAGGDTFINGIIEAAGCVNVAADVQGWSYSAEELLEADPYIIIVPSWGYDDFIATEPYTELSAVQNGRVLEVDNNTFERVGPRNIDAIRTLYEFALDANAVAHAGA